METTRPAQAARRSDGRCNSMVGRVDKERVDEKHVRDLFFVFLEVRKFKFPAMASWRSFSQRDNLSLSTRALKARVRPSPADLPLYTTRETYARATKPGSPPSPPLLANSRR